MPQTEELYGLPDTAPDNAPWWAKMVAYLVAALNRVAEHARTLTPWNNEVYLYKARTYSLSTAVANQIPAAANGTQRFIASTDGGYDIVSAIAVVNTLATGDVQNIQLGFEDDTGVIMEPVNLLHYLTDQSCPLPQRWEQIELMANNKQVYFNFRCVANVANPVAIDIILLQRKRRKK